MFISTYKILLLWFALRFSVGIQRAATTALSVECNRPSRSNQTIFLIPCLDTLTWDDRSVIMVIDITMAAIVVTCSIVTETHHRGADDENYVF